MSGQEHAATLERLRADLSRADGSVTVTVSTSDLRGLLAQLAEAEKEVEEWKRLAASVSRANDITEADLAVAVGRADRAEGSVREVLEALDAAREWNYERGRTSSVQRIDFAIGATLPLRAVLADVAEPPPPYESESDLVDRLAKDGVYDLPRAADVAEPRESNELWPEWCSTCRGEGVVPVTEGLPQDGHVPCPECAADVAEEEKPQQ